MHKLIYLFLSAFLLSCHTTTYFIVRHAEKESANTMTSDVPLSEAGRQRAEALKDILKNENIKHVYSTDFIRTKQTATPLTELEHLTIEIYNPRDSSFTSRLKTIQDGNILVVGHSNTVDDIVNGLLNEKKIAGDLPDSQYGDLFVIKKRGKKYSFEKKHFGL